MHKKSLKFYLLSLLVLACIFSFALWQFYVPHPISGVWTCINGRWSPTGNPALPMPTTTCAKVPDGGDSGSVGPVQILNPLPGSTSSLPIILSGTVSSNADSLSYELSDSSEVLARGEVFLSKSSGPSSFREILSYLYSSPVSGNVSLVIFRSSPTGGRDVLARTDFNLSSEDFSSAKIYFSNTNLIPKNKKSCGTVFPVERLISKLPGAEGQPLQLLLDGLSEKEFQNGYRTDLPPETKLNSLVITDGLAIADFKSDLLRGGDDDCHLVNIESQIKSTLSALPGVVRVELTADGKPWGKESK